MPDIIRGTAPQNAWSCLEKIPLLSPKELDSRLVELGYRGQGEARQAICLVAYRHLKRLKSIYLQKVPPESLPPRTNTILLGPTGCGKTYIIELLFGRILKLPYVIVEMTRFSETGYVGDDVLNIITRLISAAGNRPELARCGVIAMDEFDKLAGSCSNIRFSGQGTTKDVSGYGVQRELLKMVEGSDIEVSLNSNYGLYQQQPKTSISTRDVTFFALGAFTGLKGINAIEGEVGFLSRTVDKQAKGDAVAYRLEQQEADDIGNFQSYGFIPELIARFNRIIPFQPLDASTLANILKIKIVGYQREFKEEGLDLNLDDAALDLFVNDALKKKTGARGLESSIIKHLEDLGFRYFGQGNTGAVTLKVADKQVISEVKVRA